jgi:hypothetical protein
VKVRTCKLDRQPIGANAFSYSALYLWGDDQHRASDCG